MRFDSLSGWMPSSPVRLILLAVVVAHLLGNTAMPLTLPAASGQLAARKAMEGGCCCAAAGKACQCGSGCCGSSVVSDEPEPLEAPEDAVGKVVWIQAPLRSQCNGLGAGSILLVPAVLADTSAIIGVYFPVKCSENTQYRQMPGIGRAKPAAPPPKV